MIFRSKKTEIILNEDWVLALSREGVAINKFKRNLDSILTERRRPSQFALLAWHPYRCARSSSGQHFDVEEDRIVGCSRG
jgi:hypothetical protein